MGSFEVGVIETGPLKAGQPPVRSARALRGRGWRGLLALGLFLTTCVTITTGSPATWSPIRSLIGYFSGNP
jgi:hypothetical protein